MIRGILIAILGIAVISTGYWGYKEHQEKDAVSAARGEQLSEGLSRFNVPSGSAARQTWGNACDEQPIVDFTSTCRCMENVIRST